MNYVGHGRYEYIDHKGSTFETSKEELINALKEIEQFEGTGGNYYAETCPDEEVYANDVRYELLVVEIKDSGYKDIIWSDELEVAFETVISCAMNKARDFYQDKYYLIGKD